MSQRDSGYERKERDCYETPGWVTEALIPHIPKRVTSVWEPACGSGKMTRVFDAAGYQVRATDIVTGDDFLKVPKNESFPAIITNPPYALAQEFCEHAIALACGAGFVAMLLRTDFDHAKSRMRLFTGQLFCKKLVLTQRICWFEGSKGSPSFNHAWFMWDYLHQGPPTIAYH